MAELNFSTVIILLVIAAAVLPYLAYRWGKHQAEKTAHTAYQLAREQAKEIHLLKDLAETLNQTLPPSQALEAGLEKVALQFGAASGWFLTLTPDHKAELSAGYQLPPNLELARTNERSWALCACMKEMMSGQLTSPRPFQCERLARAEKIPEDQRQHLSLPVHASGVPVGILNLVFSDGRSFTENELRLLSALGNQFGGASERARLFKEVHVLAITDPLTGLYNRRHFFAIAANELERSRRYQRTISLAILDIDHFKQINDTYGHLAGDRALQEVASLCRSAVRRIDMVGRFGGEEILLLMPETHTEHAVQAMERLRVQVEQMVIPSPRGDARVTVSIGVTTLAENETIDIEQFLDRADQALYQSKNNGRNQVSVL